MKSKLLRYAVAGVTIVFLLLAASSVILQHSPVALVVVRGGSMYPTIRPGDTLLCVSTKLTGIQVGDVYVYSSVPGMYVVHRIINQSGNMYLFKGDNNLYADGYVAGEKIICKAVLRIPSTVWITVLGVLVSAGYVYVVSREKRNGQGFTTALALIIVSFVSLGTLSLHEPWVYVKPNPTPVSTAVTVVGNRTLITIDSAHTVESIECFSNGGMLPCWLHGNVVEVAAVVSTIELRMKLRSCYNITVIEIVEVGRGG